MQLTIEHIKLPERNVQPADIETYMTFRTAFPKPAAEEAHLRNILRFYLARAMQKENAKQIFILPELQIDNDRWLIDVLAKSNERWLISVCEPASVTSQTEALLEALAPFENVEVIVVHSQFGESGRLPERFARQLDEGRFRLLGVVPPPFDDVYEYDIWMFETTFRNLYESRS